MPLVVNYRGRGLDFVEEIKKEGSSPVHVDFIWKPMAKHFGDPLPGLSLPVPMSQHLFATAFSYSDQYLLKLDAIFPYTEGSNPTPEEIEKQKSNMKDHADDLLGEIGYHEKGEWGLHSGENSRIVNFRNNVEAFKEEVGGSIEEGIFRPPIRIAVHNIEHAFLFSGYETTHILKRFQCFHGLYTFWNGSTVFRVDTILNSDKSNFSSEHVTEWVTTQREEFVKEFDVPVYGGELTLTKGDRSW